jgi:hypothetical protein
MTSEVQLQAAEELVHAAEDEAREAARYWDEQWLAFPTVSRDEHGTWHYWDVQADSAVYQDDWPQGDRLARDTILQMQRFPEGASVLRRILREIDLDSTVAQGFLNRIEDALSYPRAFLPECLEIRDRV